MKMPKNGTFERIVLDKMLSGQSVSYLDFEGTGITEENLPQIISNLQTGMFEAECDEITLRN